MKSWRETYRQARLEACLDGGIVRCGLCPRSCEIKEGRLGVCRVRGNREGRLVTYCYGKGLQMAEEVIETEAVFHYAPGARILSLGNLGCNLNCAYCQNWKTSQARFIEDRDVHDHTPEGLVETALRHGIQILSWTYNDPVVWHEFVRDTAKLAHEAGLKNLFKSAFYITPEAVEELLPHIDIFSISIKAIDEIYYRRLTTGRLQPVLDATRQVHRAGKHVEISNLMVTDLSDDETSARKMAGWVLEALGPDVPLHFVRFHPDYRMGDTVRTPIDRLRRAREIALDMGCNHVYLGNVNDDDAGSITCAGCGTPLVRRFGLHAEVESLNDTGACAWCGRDAHVERLWTERRSERRPLDALPSPEALEVRPYAWRGAISSVHVEVRNLTDRPLPVYYRRRRTDGLCWPWERLTFAPGESYRFLVAKSDPGESGLDVAVHRDLRSNLHEAFDRAHFPTVALEEAVAPDDTTPLPRFTGRSESVAAVQEDLGRNCTDSECTCGTEPAPVANG